MIIRAAIAFLKEFWIPIVVVAIGVLLGLLYTAQLDAAERRGYNQAKKEAVEAQRIANEKAQHKIAQIDEDRTKESKNAQKEIAALRDSVRSGERRLYVRTKTPTEGSICPGVGDGETRAELNKEDAENIVSIVGEGDAAIIQLGAAQDIIRTLTEK